jgi:hypothetical protein
VRGVVDAVGDARYDARTDEPGSGLRVDEALARVEAASREWLAANDELVAALDVAAERQRVSESEIGAARSALGMLDVAVAAEVAIARRLEAVDGNPRLADLDLPNWPPDDPEILGPAAFGDRTVRNPGLVALLYAGTDDDPGREQPGLSNSDIAVRGAVMKILQQAADATEKIFERLLVGSIADVVGVPGGGVVDPKELIRWLLEHLGEWGLKDAVDEMSGRISKLVRQLFKRATSLLIKVLGEDQAAVLGKVSELLEQDAANLSRQLLVSAMSWVYETGQVEDRAWEGFNPEGRSLPASDRDRRIEKLKKLEKSNRRWVGPVEALSHGIGPLWAVPIPCVPIPVPAAPAAAIVLLAWVVLISGDQLDAGRPYPDVWKGVVRRSHGE